MKKYVSRIGALLCFCIFYYYICQFFPGLFGYHQFHYTADQYHSEIEMIIKKKSSLKEEYKSNPEKTHNRAKHLFQEQLENHLFPYWLGTNYDFYGQTYVPGKGEIACGYFVTTLLEDMGVELDRNGLAKLASEQMIKALVQKESIKRYSNQPLKRVLSDIEFNGKGVFIIGLDTHTGFLVNDGEEIYFIHASGRRPWQVIEEIAEESIVLNESIYRVTGNLTDDQEFIEKWLN